MNFDERKLKGLINHQSIAELADFPACDFKELRKLESSRKITIGLEYSGSRELTTSLGGFAMKLVVLFLSWVPLLVPMGAIGAAVIYHRLAFLFGVLGSALAFALANPLNPMRGCVTLTAWLAVPAFLWAVADERSALAFAIASALITTAAVRGLYYITTLALRLAALESEPLFLYLYERRLCTVRDNMTGRIHSMMERAEHCSEQ